MHRSFVISSRSGRVLVGVAPLLALAAVLAGYRALGGEHEPEYSTPAAPFSDVLEVPRESLLAYAASLQFDSTHMAGDEQPLPVWDDGGNVVRTVMVKIEPERGAAYLTEDELKVGRIIGRLIAEAEYPGFGIPQGITYVWVDGWDSVHQVMIPADSLQPLQIIKSMKVHDLPGLTLPAPPARLVETEDAVRCCIPCGRPRNCPCAWYSRPGSTGPR